MKTVWIYVDRGLPYRARGSIGQSERPYSRVGQSGGARMVLYDGAPLPDAARCLTVTGPVTVALRPPYGWRHRQHHRWRHWWRDLLARRLP